MERHEVAKILRVIQASYPRHFQYLKESEKDELLFVWTSIIGEYDYWVGDAGLKMFLANDTKGFPPVPGQIIDCIHRITSAEMNIMTEQEAWVCVYKAICNSGYNAEQEFEKLPDACKKAIGRPESLKNLAMMDTDTVWSVEKSLFERNYRTVVERMKQDAKIPKDVMALIEDTMMERDILNEKMAVDVITCVDESSQMEISRPIDHVVPEFVSEKIGRLRTALGK